MAAVSRVIPSTAALSNPEYRLTNSKLHRHSALACHHRILRYRRLPVGIYVQAKARRDVQPAQVLLRRAKGKCCGCGVKLQSDDPLVVGYTSSEQLQSSEHLLAQVQCERCLALQRGALVAGVSDYYQGSVRGAEAAARQLVTPEQLREQLKVVQSRFSFVVLLVDLLDASSTLLASLRTLVGANPVLLVATKADLLPGGTQPGRLVPWLRHLAAGKRLKLAGVHVVSSATGEGLPACLEAISSQRAGRDLYVMGAANVGKTAFVAALLETAGQAGQLAATSAMPLQSGMPGTTLGLLPVAAFSSGGLMYDTPGLHLFFRVLHMLSPASLAELCPQQPLEPHVTPMLGRLSTRSSKNTGISTSGNSSASGSEQAMPYALSPATTADGTPQPLALYQWGSLVEVAVLQGPATTALVFYSPPALLPVRCSASSLPGAAQQLQPSSQPASQQADGWATAAQPLSAASTSAADSADSADSTDSADSEAASMFGSAEVALRGGLLMHKMLRLTATGSWDALGDVSVAGVPGWVAVYAPGASGPVVLSVRAPKGVEVFLRPAVPVPPALGRRELAGQVQRLLEQEQRGQQQQGRRRQQEQEQQQEEAEEEEEQEQEEEEQSWHAAGVRRRPAAGLNLQHAAGYTGDKGIGRVDAAAPHNHMQQQQQQQPNLVTLASAPSKSGVVRWRYRQVAQQDAGAAGQRQGGAGDESAAAAQDVAPGAGHEEATGADDAAGGTAGSDAASAAGAAAGGTAHTAASGDASRAPSASLSKPRRLLSRRKQPGQ